MTISGDQKRFSVTLRVASVKGASHIAARKPNQDCGKAGIVGGAYFVAVSDGVGSHKHSRIGSHLVCHYVKKAAQRIAKGKLDNKGIGEFIFEKMHHLHLPKFIKTKMAATCLYAIYFSNKLYIGQCGDGLVLARKGDKIRALKKGEDEFVNVVDALNPIASRANWKYASNEISTEDTIQILLCTDGISEDIDPEAYSRFLDTFVENSAGPDGVKKLIHILQHWPVPGSTDDKTVGLLIINNG